MPRPRPPAGFVAIGRGVYISLPANATGLQPADDSAPSVILIFGWMGGLTRHLEHYARKYTELYPRATQIIVKCGVSFFWSSERTRQYRLLPVVEVLETLGCLPSTINHAGQASTRSRPRVLVHAFSNGGGFQLMSLGHLLCSKYPSVPPSEHLVSALIMDSLPAIGDLRRIGKAFSVAVRSTVMCYLALPIIYVVHLLRRSLQTVFGGETTEAQYLRALLQPRLLPWMNAQAPRLYIFSKKDEMVPWKEIQRHANAAKQSGLDVRCEVYEESAHVAHMRYDPERYWAAVVSLWKTALAKVE